MATALAVTCKSLGRTSSLAATGIWGWLHISGIYCLCVDFKKHIKRNPGLLKSSPFTEFSEAFKQKFLLFVPDVCAVTYYRRIFCIFPIAVLRKGSRHLRGTHCSLACSLPRDAAQGDSPWSQPSEHRPCWRAKPRVTGWNLDWPQWLCSVLFPKICLENKLQVWGLWGSSRDAGDAGPCGVPSLKRAALIYWGVEGNGGSWGRAGSEVCLRAGAREKEAGEKLSIM